MVKQKEKVFKICPYCEGKIAGFSEHHAKQNLMIHCLVSQKCKKIKDLLKKHKAK